MKSNTREKIEAGLSLAAHCASLVNLPSHVIAHHVFSLMKIAAQLHKRYEAACSYQWSDTTTYRKHTLNLEREALEHGEALGLYVEYQTDPRGWPLILSSGSGSTHAGDKFSTRLG